MVRRRSFGGRALLVASSAAVMGCSGSASPGVGPPDPGNPPVGNLVAPPTVELCVPYTPVEAKAQIFVGDSPLEPDGCNRVYEGTVRVTATAVGYAPYEADVAVSENTTHAVSLAVAP